MMELKDIEAVQQDVKKLFKYDYVIGIAEDRIHFQIDRFLDEFDEYSWKPVGEDSYHLETEHNGVKDVAVFNDYNMDLIDKVKDDNLKSEMIEKF